MRFVRLHLLSAAQNIRLIMGFVMLIPPVVGIFLEGLLDNKHIWARLVRLQSVSYPKADLRLGWFLDHRYLHSGDLHDVGIYRLECGWADQEVDR